MKTLPVILLLLGAAALARAADPVKTLRAAPEFAFGGIGYAGVRSQGEGAFREVLARPGAIADFTALLKTGNPPAQCYALVALHVLDPKAFAGCIERFRRDKSEVRTVGGCMVTTLPMSSVVANIEAGRYDMRVRPKKQPRRASP